MGVIVSERSTDQFVGCDRQVSHPPARRMIDGVRDGCGRINDFDVAPRGLVFELEALLA